MYVQNYYLNNRRVRKNYLTSSYSALCITSGLLTCKICYYFKEMHLVVLKNITLSKDPCHGYIFLLMLDPHSYSGDVRVGLLVLSQPRLVRALFGVGFFNASQRTRGEAYQLHLAQPREFR